MSKIINPFKVEQEENDLLRQLIELQKQNNELLQKLIKTQATTPSELIKKYYPDSRPANEIRINYGLIPPLGAVFNTPDNPLTYTGQSFNTKIWIVRLKISSNGITTPGVAQKLGIRFKTGNKFFPNPDPYQPYFAGGDQYLRLNDNFELDYRPTPPIEILPTENIIIEAYKQTPQPVEWSIIIEYVREV